MRYNRYGFNTRLKSSGLPAVPHPQCALCQLIMPAYYLAN